MRVENSGLEYVVAVVGNGDAGRHAQDTFINESHQTAFFLTRRPEVGSIRVQGTSLAWTYDEVQLAILFDVPPPASAVFTVSYDVACP